MSNFLDREIDGAMPKCVPHSELMIDEILLHCCTQHDAVYMSVTLSPTENIVKFVNVTERKPGALKYNMSVCLAPLYGNESKWMYLVQLFEHYKLQGVVHFYVYIYQIDEYSEKLLLDYEKTEEVELVYFDGNDRRPAKNWQFVALQDCIGRSKHESKFVTMQDLDELLMSTQKRTLLEFANERLRGPVASVSVYPYIIIRTSDPPAVYEGMETLLKHLPALIFQNSSARTYKFRTKPIFKPATVIGVLVHWVYLFEPGYTSYNSTMDEVFILHFRNSHDSEFGAKYMHILDGLGPFTARSYPDQFMSRLIFAIKGRLDCIYNKHY
ncbi:hypothetical protein NECAME_04896 [Necator americanus]|uniref:Glycosyltransferase family 92 protein n=1 Tax=Necator americanus TaxID=51031 RepID=W2SLQ2_NECAM|nr:hypothetical protein NECAME_04896 [Necator americanus]ETN70473.1 hypothetical protein NECAME_04896 [Necator americanus]